jgi:hypothetical protein
MSRDQNVSIFNIFSFNIFFKKYFNIQHFVDEHFLKMFQHFLRTANQHFFCFWVSEPCDQLSAAAQRSASPARGRCGVTDDWRALQGVAAAWQLSGPGGTPGNIQ